MKIKLKFFAKSKEIGPSTPLRRLKDYQLLDTGEGEKLERFGKYIFVRPYEDAFWRNVQNRVLNKIGQKLMENFGVLRLAQKKDGLLKIKLQKNGRWNIKE